MDRRSALKLLAGGGTVLGAAKAVHNSVLGFGIVSGTNLRQQDLWPLFADRLRVDEYAATVGSTSISVADDRLSIEGPEADDALSIEGTTRAEAADVDDRYGVAGSPVEQLVTDLPRLREGDVRVEPSQYPAFFERLDESSPRAFSVGALRGRADTVDSATVERFTGTDPTDPERLVESLADAFRDHTYYDTPRFLAGSVEDNLLFGRVDLRARFESPTDFESLETGENSGLFCTELTRRAGDALHAVPAHEARVPVAAVYVRNHRHKHVYTGISSLIAEGGDLVMPITFVDYRDATLHDDLRARRVLGEGLAAYDTRHRADDVYWRW